MHIEDKIKKLNLQLPPCPKAAAVYVPAVLSGNTIYVAGQTPKDGDKLLYKGKVGRDLSIEDGQNAARLCALRAISAIKDIVGDLDSVEQFIKITGYVNCSDDFEKHSLVIDGASKLLEEIFGDKGKHARVAVGANSLPGNAAVEIEMIVSCKSDIASV
jgi:enamine deaminase RidA (YjgF/YER057c/UK114 family)